MHCMQEGSWHGSGAAAFEQPPEDDLLDVSPEGWTNVLAAWMDASGLSDNPLDSLQPAPVQLPEPAPPQPLTSVRPAAVVAVRSRAPWVHKACRSCSCLPAHLTVSAQTSPPR